MLDSHINNTIYEQITEGLERGCKASSSSFNDDNTDDKRILFT